MIRILIVDDHRLVRVCVRTILESNTGISVVGEAASGEEALRQTRNLDPDVILMDLNLPGLSGIETTERILKTHPDVRVIFLSAYAELPYPTRVLDMGAAGYLTKACDAGELCRAVRAAGRGERYIGSDIAQDMAIALLPGTPRSPFQQLTARELEVAMMLTRGMKIRDIANVLKVSPKTVATYKYRIYAKVGVNTEVELLHETIRYGLAEAGGSCLVRSSPGRCGSRQKKGVQSDITAPTVHPSTEL